MSENIENLALQLFLRTDRFTRGVASVPGASQPSVVWRTLSSLEVLGPLRVSQIAVLERVSQPSISISLQRLTRLGYVRREPDPVDKRAVIFHITEAGIDLLEEYRNKVTEQLTPLFKTLDPLELAAIARVSDILEELTQMVGSKSTQ